MIDDLPTNSFKRALAAGKPQIGLWLSMTSPVATEVVAGAGFDWVLVDMEHSANELVDVVAHLRAAVGGSAEPVVRVPWNEPVLVKRLLDAGARSLLFPFVQSADEARRAVAATRYPPKGIRGVAGTTRANRYGRVKDYARRVEGELCVLVQVETQQALGEIEAIAAIDGIDGLFIGPADLSAFDGAYRRLAAAGNLAGNHRRRPAHPQGGQGSRVSQCPRGRVPQGSRCGVSVRRRRQRCRHPRPAE
jgi:4-hydroxy-2-oxoheptanedioate aldolase